MIAQFISGGLGMPDRDYYLKTEDRFREARDKYRTYIRSLFRLAGENDAQASAAAER